MPLTSSFADYPGHPTAEDVIRVDIVKSLLQLIVVIFIGGGITALFKLVDQDRERSKLHADTRSEHLRPLGRSYRSAKAPRRALRVVGLASKYKKLISTASSQVGPHKEQMERINDIQLELEELKIESSYFPEIISPNSVSSSLDSMQEYLGVLVTEFEDTYPLLLSQQVVDPEKLRHLDEFTGATERDPAPETSRFKQCFSAPYKTAIQIISKSLV